MPTSEIETTWPFPLIETTSDKRTARPGVPYGVSHELRGFDGTIDGGLRPISGFKRVYDLVYYGSGFEEAPNTLHGPDSRIIDFFPIDFKIGTDSYGYGFVYRSTREGPGDADQTSDVFVDFWNSATDTTDFGVKGSVVMTGVPSSAPMHVEVFGRLVYVFVEGVSPSLFYVDEQKTMEFVATQDAWLDEEAPDELHGLEEVLRVRTGAPLRRNAVLRFDMTNAPPDLNIEDARLNMNIEAADDDGVEITYSRLTNFGWDELTATWNTPWVTPGGDIDVADQVIQTFAGGGTGTVSSLDISNVVQSHYEDNPDTVDLHMAATFTPPSAGGERVFSARERENVLIRPTLIVTFEGTAQYVLVKVGSDPNDPNVTKTGPGKIPKLVSPENAIDVGTFVDVLDYPQRPAAGQIVLSDDDLNELALHPDPATGLCPDDPSVGGPTPVGGCSTLFGFTDLFFNSLGTNVAVSPGGAPFTPNNDDQYVFALSRDPNAAKRVILSVHFVYDGGVSEVPLTKVPGSDANITGATGALYHAHLPNLGPGVFKITCADACIEIMGVAGTIEGANLIAPLDDRDGVESSGSTASITLGQTTTTGTVRIAVALSMNHSTLHSAAPGTSPGWMDASAAAVGPFRTVTHWYQELGSIGEGDLPNLQTLVLATPGFPAVDTFIIGMTVGCSESSFIPSGGSTSEPASESAPPSTSETSVSGQVPCADTCADALAGWGFAEPITIYFFRPPTPKQNSHGVPVDGTLIKWRATVKRLDTGQTVVINNSSVFSWRVQFWIDGQPGFLVDEERPLDQNTFDPDEELGEPMAKGTTYKFKVTVVVKNPIQYNWGDPNQPCGALECKFVILTFSTEGQFPCRRLDAGDYAFAYFLFDSKTGRRSALSEIAHVETADFQESTMFALLELTYDSGVYDQAWVYRSVRVQGAGGVHYAGILQLDSIANLEDYQTCLNGEGRQFDPAVTSLRHAVYCYQLEDKQLVFQDVYANRSTFDERMPFGGTALAYETVMLVSSITQPRTSSSEEARVGDTETGLGELRWSSLTDIGVELFPPFNRYVPSVPSNGIQRMLKVGGNAIGWSKDRMYHIRRHGRFIVVQEMHEGYGILNPRAVDVVGSMAYFVSPEGLKAVDAAAQLDDVRVLNQVILEEWLQHIDEVDPAKHTHNIIVALDPFAGVLFVHNPEHQHTALLWFNTNKTTELRDMPFTLVKQGAWPIQFDSVSDYDNTLVKRALWVQNAPENGISTWRPRVYVLDQERRRTIADGPNAGQSKIRMLDTHGDSRFDVLTFDGVTMTVDVTGLSAPHNVEGAKLYVMDAADATLVGKSATIREGSGGTITLVTAEAGELATLAAGDRVAISPVQCRWVGANVGLKTPEGMAFGSTGFLRLKHVNTLGVAFTDVTGPPAGTLDAFYRGLAFKGSERDPMSTARPVNEEGEPVISVNDGEGEFYAAFPSSDPDVEGRTGVAANSLSVGVEIAVPDLDFRMLEAEARGKILGMERSVSTRST